MKKNALTVSLAWIQSKLNSRKRIAKALRQRDAKLAAARKTAQMALSVSADLAEKLDIEREANALLHARLRQQEASLQAMVSTAAALKARVSSGLKSLEVPA